MQNGIFPPLTRLAALVLMAVGLSAHAAEPAGKNTGAVTTPAAETAEKTPASQPPASPRDEGLRLYGQRKYEDALPYLMTPEAQRACRKIDPAPHHLLTNAKIFVVTPWQI